MGMVGIAITFAPAVGPTLSGILLEKLSWHYIFLSVLPFSLAALIASSFILRNVSEPKPVKLDVLSVILSTLGFGGILYGFGSAGVLGWGSPYVITAIVIGMISLAWFAARQLRLEQPLINLEIFKSAEYTFSIVISFLVNCVTFASMILLPIYLQSSRGMSALETAFFLLPGTILMGITSPLAGRLYDRFGVKWLGFIGMLLLVMTTAFYTNLTETTGVLPMVIVYTVRSFGLTFLFMPLMTAGLNALRPELHGHGATMQNTLQAIAGSIGAAIMTTIMTAQSNLYIAEEMSRAGIAPSATGSIGDIAAAGLLHGVNRSFTAAAIFAAAGLANMIALAVILDRKKRDICIVHEATNK